MQNQACLSFAEPKSIIALAAKQVQRYKKNGETRKKKRNKFGIKSKNVEHRRITSIEWNNYLHNSKKMSTFAEHLRNKGSSARAQRDGTSFESASENINIKN